MLSEAGFVTHHVPDEGLEAGVIKTGGALVFVAGGGGDGGGGGEGVEELVAGGEGAAGGEGEY